MSKHRKKLEFSKILLLQESILVWATTICYLILAFMSIGKDFLGSFDWLGTLCVSLWGAYGVSQAFYLKKSEKENCSGVTYLKAKHDLERADSDEDPVG